MIGDVVLGDDVSVWYNSVLRGDCNFIRVGDRSNIQDNCAIHVTDVHYPTVLEEEVTLGHGAIVHGAVVRRGRPHRDPRDRARRRRHRRLRVHRRRRARGSPDDRAAAHALARHPRRGRCASSPTPRSRTSQHFHSQLPGLQRGVLPRRRKVGAMTAPLKSPKGTHDLLPPETERFAAVEAVARKVFGVHGYGEIRTPTFESTELFARSVGETTDIVHKEMYTFPDRKGRSLTLRPENTAGVVRALVENGLQDRPKPIRLWYAGPQFRYEQPQAGRYREFRQIGVELLGVPVRGRRRRGPRDALPRSFASLGLSDLVATINCIPNGEAARRPSRGRSATTCAPRRGTARDRGPAAARGEPAASLRLEGPRGPAHPRRGAGDARLPGRGVARSSRRAQAAAPTRAWMPFVESSAIVRGLDYYTLTVFEVTSTQPRRAERDPRRRAVRRSRGGRSADRRPPPSGFAIGEDRLVAAMRRTPRPARAAVLRHSGFARRLRLRAGRGRTRSGASRPEAVVEIDLTGRGLVKGLSRASQILESPRGYAFRVRRCAR